MKFKSRYNVPSNLAYHTKIEGPCLTSQKFADRVDLNRIIGFESGELIIKDQNAFLEAFDEEKMYNDFSAGTNQTLDCTGMSFQEMSNNLAGFTNEFNALPSEVRRMYRDDVNVFLDAIVEHSKNKMNASTVTPAEEVKTVEPVQTGSSSADGEKSV